MGIFRMWQCRAPVVTAMLAGSVVSANRILVVL
jgi:hypothetical protein